MYDQLSDVARHLRQARRVLFITGAGLSADSGLPTYRGVGGLYDGRVTSEELPIEDILSGEMLRRRPEVTWKYLLEIEKACRGARPNAGHEVIARLEAEKPDSWVLTQNVDGLHRAAGSRNVIEIHGRFSDLYCTRPGCAYRQSVTDYRNLPDVPACPLCGGPVRPDVVLFGELLPEAAVAALERELARGFDLLFSVGTSSLFPYITQPVLLAKEARVPTVEVNPGETDLSRLVDYRLPGGAAEVLSRLYERYARDAAD